MDPFVGMPAIAETIADDIGGGAMGCRRHAGGRKQDGQPCLLEDS